MAGRGETPHAIRRPVLLLHVEVILGVVARVRHVGHDVDRVEPQRLDPVEVGDQRVVTRVLRRIGVAQVPHEAVVEVRGARPAGHVRGHPEADLVVPVVEEPQGIPPRAMGQLHVRALPRHAVAFAEPVGEIHLVRDPGAGVAAHRRDAAGLLLVPRPEDHGEVAGRIVDREHAREPARAPVPERALEALPRLAERERRQGLVRLRGIAGRLDEALRPRARDRPAGCAPRARAAAPCPRPRTRW